MKKAFYRLQILSVISALNVYILELISKKKSTGAKKTITIR